MNKECLQIFREIAAKKKDGDLYLKILSNLIRYTGSYEKLEWKDITPSTTTVVSELLTIDEKPEDIFKDLRLKSMEFKYFRTFPPAVYKNFGLQFLKDGKPCSTFLVGRNSTGKSTIFDAIEYFYAHKLSNAELKSIPKAEEHEYLTFGFGRINNPRKISPEDVRLKVETQTTKGNYSLCELNPLCMPAMFCSDNDIFTIGKLYNEDLRSFILEQLGYTDLQIINERLVNLDRSQDFLIKNSSKNQESSFLEKKDIDRVIEVFMDYYHHGRERAISQCKNDIKDINKIIEEIKNKLITTRDIKTANRLLTNEWESIQRNVTYYLYLNKEEDIILQNEINKLFLKYELLHQSLCCSDPTDAFSLFKKEQEKAQERVMELDFSTEENQKTNVGTDVLAEFRTIKINLEAALRSIYENFVDEYGFFIENCLASFSDKSDTFKFSKEGPIIQIDVLKEEGDFPSTPARYLNSFRFKLYAISLKLSLAFWYMKKNKRILPIAIDDVFNANDFDNSIYLQQFVHKIYDTYHNKVCNTIPLQLIMLTHDEIILNTFRKGFNINEIFRWGEEEREKNQQQYNLYKDNIITGRILPYEEVQHIYTHEKSSGEHLYEHFYNIYIKLN